MKLFKGVILLFLASIFKVAVAENSTKMFLMELEIEASVESNVMNILYSKSVINVGNAIVTEITNTTDCTLNEKLKNCTCMSGHTPSEDICKNHGKDGFCLLEPEQIYVCLSDKRVSINGTTELPDECSILCTGKKDSSDYIKKSQEIRDQLARHYSKFKYFDSLTINGFRPGSTVVYYTVQLLGSVKLDELVLLTTNLSRTELVTTGLIDIKVPEDQPIDINSTAIITCTTPQTLGEVKWFLTDTKNKTTQITKGKEATLSSTNQTDTVTLIGISGSWKGTFMCVYTHGSIQHTASKELDIALLPDIQARSVPQFPDCKKDPRKIISCTIECNISYSNENYTVTWDSDLTDVKQSEIQGKVLSYTAVKTIYCSLEERVEEVTASCTFINNRSKSKSSRKATVLLPIIHREVCGYFQCDQPDTATGAFGDRSSMSSAESKICEPEGVWPVAKSDHTANLSCVNSAVGLRTRYCDGTNWKEEVSSCVNVDLHGIQKDVEELNKGIGFIKDNAKEIFGRIKDSTTIETFNSFANINASVNIFAVMNDVSQRQLNIWNDTVIPDFVNSASNVLNDTAAWVNPAEGNLSLPLKYLHTVEEIVNNTNLSSADPHKYENVELRLCRGVCKTFNGSVDGDGVVVVGFRNLYQILPQPNLLENNTVSETTILSVTTVNKTNGTINVKMKFDYSKTRPPNHEMYCAFWDESQRKWSTDGCRWGGASDAELCECEHNSAFTILMSKDEVTLPYMEELTYVGLGISIVSLVLCLIIEILVWDTVVKSDISNFRHVAIFNIALCLLFAHVGFLASADPKKTPAQWCSILTVVKHFFFLAVFFWMLCLSFVILHQIIFVFDHLRKKVFWGLSITLGYVCPLLCVAITFITFKNGEAGHYYSQRTCWLVYNGMLKGSIYAFFFPVGTIVFINLFTLAVVIMKIATPTVSEAKARDEKDVAKSMIKTIVFLSPILGITWIFGFFLISLDLTVKPWAAIVNYTFTALNSLQGFFILLTNCVGEKKVRDALAKRFKGSKQSAHSKSESSTKATSSIIKK